MKILGKEEVRVEGRERREGGRDKVLTWGGSTQNGSPSPSWQGQSQCPVS